MQLSRSGDGEVDYSRIKGKKSEDQGITQKTFNNTGAIYISGLPADVTVEEVRKTQTLPHQTH